MEKGKQIMISNNIGGCNDSMTNDAFINQSKLKILLYDSDPESCEEVSTLLTKCSYEGILSFYLILLRSPTNFYFFFLGINSLQIYVSNHWEVHEVSSQYVQMAP